MPETHTHSIRILRIGAAAIAMLATAAPARAQEGYRQPPAPIAQILDAPLTPLVWLSPDGRTMLLLERPGLPSIEEVAAPIVRLAGQRVNPRTNARAREVVYTGLAFRSLRGDGAERRVALPAGARVANAEWSPDGARVSFTLLEGRRATPWVAEAATGQARRLADVSLAGAAGAPCAWSGSTALVCLTIPAGRGEPPSAAETPTGPVVQESEGRAAPNRTYQDLLASPDDERLFEHYFTNRIARIALDGSVTPLGEPGIHVAARPSPDGRFLLVERVHRPYSYLVPLWRFPREIEIRDASGALVRRIADVPLQESVPTAFDAVPTGPRGARWRADQPATLVWVEALDRGDPAIAAEKRDRALMLAAPFAAEAATLAEVGYRIEDITWATPTLAVLEEQWWKTRRARTWVIDPSGAAGARLLFDRSFEDRYGDPGRFVTTRGPLGTTVLLTTPDGRAAYLDGEGASPEGDRPFLDRIDLATGKTTRLFRSAAPHYETVVAVLDRAGREALVRRESATEAPNYFIRDLRRDRLTQLTRFADPAPQFAGVTKRLITYRRGDGVELSATLYLPAGHDSTKGPLPFLFWAYPTEFTSRAAASQVSGSPYRFTRPSGASHLFALTQGYGVLDDPSMPIIGENGKEANDSYVEQLVSSAKAAVDEVVRLGVADRERIAIGGHSYGAFMTANLLAHSDLFRAGIARSGAYNRTLTPFGFQAEERTFWQAGETYARMSPFTYAHRIDEPILLIHGVADDNSGTFPVQSERMYAAIKGNGGKARLVMLPAEAHGYRARESVGHTLWEMVTWLETYVKNGDKPKVE
jgi:dipeptidyl aminopeptidase/acylaminoacyl peptidase